MTSWRTGRLAHALESGPGREVAAVWPRPREPAGRSRIAGDSHSRRVAFLKRVLPVIGTTLLALVAVWPQLGPWLESVRIGFSVIDLREARELRMLNPRYAGFDRFNRPYVVTSAIGRQVPDRDNLMSLERPRAEMTMHGGALVVLTAVTAIYQSQAQLLDLFDDVSLVHENGTRFVTKRAHVDVAASTADGDEPVSGHGPSGDIAAQGFRIRDKGDTIIFTGKSNLLLKGAKPSVNAATPPALPEEIAATAARIEAAATVTGAVMPEPSIAGAAAAGPSRAETTEKPDAAAKPRGTVKRDAKLPGRGSPAGRRSTRDAG
jgi:lipopolysaccharide export system protein LptC